MSALNWRCIQRRGHFSAPVRREKWVEKREGGRERGKCFCFAVRCGTHAVEEKRCCRLFVLDMELQLSHLTLMNATLHFSMSTASEVCHYVKIWMIINCAAFIYQVFVALLYFSKVVLNTLPLVEFT